MSPWASCGGLLSALFRGPKDRTSGGPELCELRPWITLTWLCGQLLGSASRRVHSSHHSPLIGVLAVPPILCAVAPTGNCHDRCDATHIESVSHRNRRAKNQLGVVEVKMALVRRPWLLAGCSRRQTIPQRIPRRSPRVTEVRPLLPLPSTSTTKH